VLFVLVPAACLTLALFGLSMCRVAARSDAAETHALARSIATTQLADGAVAAPGRPAERRSGRPGERYRAMG
jgi:hypothetical protein